MKEHQNPSQSPMFVNNHPIHIIVRTDAKTSQDHIVWSSLRWGSVTTTVKAFLRRRNLLPCKEEWARLQAEGYECHDAYHYLNLIQRKVEDAHFRSCQTHPNGEVCVLDHREAFYSLAPYRGEEESPMDG